MAIGILYIWNSDTIMHNQVREVTVSYAAPDTSIPTGCVNSI